MSSKAPHTPNNQPAKISVTPPAAADIAAAGPVAIGSSASRMSAPSVHTATVATQAASQDTHGAAADTTALPGSGVAATAGLVAVGAPVVPPGATVLTVGVGKEFSTIAAAVAAAQDGDVILVDAGTYTNDFATVSAKITLIGVGGMVNMVATEPPPDLKGILTVDNDVTIQNFSFSGCAIPDADGGNGAGIRYEGGQMVLQNDAFVGNQDGILAPPTLGFSVNTISIDHCLFSGNGSGSGFTHNCYIGAVDQLTVTNSVFEGAVVGHEFKSRALVNVIEGNVFQDGPTGTASYDIDLPNGGNDTVTDNIIEKGPDSQNDVMVHFGGEGIPYAGSQLTISGNLFENDLGAQTVAVLNQTAITVNITGNAFANFQGAAIADGPAVETSNVDGNGNALPDTTLTGVLPGSTDVITDSDPHSVTLGGTIMAVEGGGGLLTVFALGGHVVAVGGSGGMDFSESSTSGGNTISTVAGSINTIDVVGQDLIDSQGTDQITCGAGNITGQIGGTAIVQDGTGADQWSVLGSATITGNGGSPVISVGAQGSVVVTGALGYLQVLNDGGKATIDITQGGAEEALSIAGGAVDLRVYNATLNVATAAGPQGAVLHFGAGNAVVQSAGADQIWAGSGSETIIVSGSATVYAGTGSLAFYNHGSAGATLYGNGGTYLIGGDTGNITYYGGQLASTVNLQLSSNTLIGGAGLLTVNGGSREVLTGGGGGLDYNGAVDGGGANIITTAANSANTLTLAGGDVVQSWGHDTIIGGTGNQVITVHGNATVTGSSGASTLSFFGHDKFTGVGTDACTVNSGATLNATAGVSTRITETGAFVSLRVPTSTGNTGVHVTASGGGASLWNNTDGSVGVTTAAGTSTTLGIGAGVVAVSSYGADTIQAGGGRDTITITTANTLIDGGAGALVVHDCDWTTGDQVTIHGGTGTLQYDQGPGALVFVGGSGAANINGEYGSLNITGGSGALTITGGSRGVSFVGGSGSANIALTPGGGNVTFGTGATTVQEASYGAADVYSFLAGSGGGNDTISGFRVGVDQLTLQAGVSLENQHATSGGTSLLLTNGTQVQLAGVFSTAGMF